MCVCVCSVCARCVCLCVCVCVLLVVFSIDVIILCLSLCILMCSFCSIVGLQLVQFIIDFDPGSYVMQVISLMLPLKYDLVKLGGSWAQRQVFSVTLIHAAIRSKQLPLALALIAELRVWSGHHAFG